MSLNRDSSVAMHEEKKYVSSAREQNCDITLQSSSGLPSQKRKRQIHDRTSCEEKRIRIRHSDTNQDIQIHNSEFECVNYDQEEMKKSAAIKRVEVDNQELENVLEGIDDDIESVLEQTNLSQSPKLTRNNVKNILRHVITNEYVLAMVRNTMKSENSDEELEESIFEPKLTRSKAKELRERQYTLPWPVSTPVKQAEQVSKKLLEEEFSDESSSDEDYRPNEEECPSEEDYLVASPKTGDVEPSSSKNIFSPVPKPVEDFEDENRLVIALPESDISVNKSLVEPEADKIALRTRSKLCLNDTPLEAIEASFVAPDITVDMYDTKCNDEEWLKFLCELSKPIDANVVVEQHGEELDDADDDPEYNVLEDDDTPDISDLRYDEKVKISRKELNALIAEILESAQQELNDCDEEEEEETTVYERTETPCITDLGITFVESVRSQWITWEERLQLDEQMRMYVQLLIQSYLLSFGIPELNFINISAKLFLDEIKMFASREMAINVKSAFYAHNLDGALDIVNNFENNRVPVRQRPIVTIKKGLPSISSSKVRQTLVNSSVFIYTELLPVCGFHSHFEKQKTVFTPSEDHLIALGLEQFSFCKNPVPYIKSLLVPTKTEQQIKIRIKNSKCVKATIENPIKYFHVYKQAPSIQRIIRVFDPENVKAPKEYPPDILPEWMKPYCKCTGSSVSVIMPIAPFQTKQSPVKVAIVHPTVRRPRKFCPILPRGMHFSPLKQISPILKKYSQQRRTVSVVPFNNNNSPCKKKSMNFSNRSVKSCAIQPKPISESEDSNTIIQTSGEMNKNDYTDSNNIQANQQDVCLSSINQKRSEVSRCHTEETSCVPLQVNSPRNLEQISKIIPSETSKELNANRIFESTTNKPETPLEIEIADEAEEEVIDDEQDLAALMAASSTICKKQQSATKKRNRLQRDLESSLALLQPSILENDPKKEEREALFANSYLLRVSETLKGDPETYEKFLKLLCKHQHCTRSPINLYWDLKEILKDYPLLVNDFVAFLNPEQAIECGKYKEYVILQKIREFLRKIEIHFSNQPQHLLRILRTFAQLRQQKDIKSTDVLSSLQPLLRNQSHLVEELTHLLPDAQPSEHLMTDFEEMTVPNSDEEYSSIDSCEEITIPDVPDPYGGKDCPCDCHTSSTETRMQNRSRHCVKCGIKFIDGRIYIQTGKVLKPAQVIYHDLPPESAKEKVTLHQTSSKGKHAETAAMKSVTVVDSSGKQETNCGKKDNPKTTSVSQRAAFPCTDEAIPSTSNLPCDVIEDTVFPPITNNTSKSVPSDFSHLRDMIARTGDKDSENGIIRGSKSTPHSSVLTHHEISKVNEPASGANKVHEISQTVKWTRDEDKLIIYNCQRLGISKQAFAATASALERRTAEQVEERFIYLMKFLSKEITKK